ncbi:MAG: hypothetical protein ACJ746_22790 [Bryobacteraceae bacterium]
MATLPKAAGSADVHTAAGSTYGDGSAVPLRMAEVVSALSHALDLSAGLPVGHSVRTCVLGMRIAHEIGLSGDQLNDLYYGLLPTKGRWL